MAAFMQRDPSAAFASLLFATVLWGPAGIIYSLPATFLQVERPSVLPPGFSAASSSLVRCLKQTLSTKP